jgi:hypothetical protein
VNKNCVTKQNTMNPNTKVTHETVKAADLQRIEKKLRLAKISISPLKNIIYLKENEMTLQNVHILT